MVQKEKCWKKMVQSKINILIFINNINNSLIKTNNSDIDSDSTSDSNRPSYMEKFDVCNKIFSNLESKCNL